MSIIPNQLENKFLTNKSSEELRQTKKNNQYNYRMLVYYDSILRLQYEF